MLICCGQSGKNDLSVLVGQGGHAYETPNLRRCVSA